MFKGRQSGATPGACAEGVSGSGVPWNGGTSTDRGANSLDEFTRQRAKIVAAILAISPDVTGLTEVRPPPSPSLLSHETVRLSS